MNPEDLLAVGALLVAALLATVGYLTPGRARRLLYVGAVLMIVAAVAVLVVVDGLGQGWSPN